VNPGRQPTHVTQPTIGPQISSNRIQDSSWQAWFFSVLFPVSATETRSKKPETLIAMLADLPNGACSLMCGALIIPEAPAFIDSCAIDGGGRPPDAAR
jgi:hypothetical protein